ncbi:MAG: CoB--CoM heterodisulfide reductase iron-sulfur subunit A family protein [Firmicutes bacterium]|nr:CoB--CoM heterodisulfide reductase iron-sulfur subunit A family protein [Bacillota bacterium]
MTDKTTDRTGAVLVVGAGISGMQSALDLAEMGYKVYLVEKSPAIGGKMPMLDKTFPTNDCSMCIMSPKLVECGRHRNIEILTMAEIVDLKGEPGNFQVTVKKHPRYVDTEKCLGCGSCAEACPQDVPNEFNQGLSERKAIYKPYPQAFPNAYVIDKENCLECGSCEEVCPVSAINYEDEEEDVVIQVGAVILCPGFELFDAQLRGEYGYGIYDNVVTSIQFERMLSASGPFQGHIKRPSDGKEPKKIAFIQCVGSRDLCNQGYCSAVCCMYATKEAIIAREHIPGLESTIFAIDIRVFGKNFERYYNRAKDDYNVRYVKCMISSVKELQKTKDLRLSYRNPEGKIVEEDFDLIVLSVGMKPASDARELAEVMGLELNQYNFCKLKSLSGTETTRPGIYVAGTFSGPKDIPETVTQAIASAGDSATFLAAARNSLVSERTFPDEKDVSAEEPRIGVFVCHCGINIGSVVDVPAVAEYAKTLPHVVHAQEGLYVCSQDSQASMKQLIDSLNLNRVVVASCSPRTHKPLFQETMREAGLNKQLFEMANIRDQCSWVHMNEPDKATQKAKDLVKMAVTKAATLQPVTPVIVDLTPSSLVIGGGVAGMSAAMTLAEQGFKVHLVEKSDRLGGIASRLNQGFNGGDIALYLREMIDKVTRHPNISIYTGCEVSEVSGYVGNFNTKLSNGQVIRHGTTIIATGAEEAKPDEYLYGDDPRVLTQLEMDEAILNNDPRLRDAKTIVMIQCVGSRDEKRPYCSRICCTKTMRLALRLKEINPQVNIVVLYRDIRTHGFHEDHYREARSKGVVFIRYKLMNKPAVQVVDERGNSVIQVSVIDRILNEEIKINADMLVLATAVIPGKTNPKLSQIFKVPLDPDGFFLEAHMKLRPVDFASEGVFLAGLAHSPKSVEGAITQGKAAAGRASIILGKKKLESKGLTAVVDKEKCQACLTCVRLCPFNAPKIKEDHKAEIEAVLCQGCGTCAGECPNKAITLQGSSSSQYLTMLDGLFQSQ